MYTPKRDDEHPRLFHMRVPPPPGSILSSFAVKDSRRVLDLIKARQVMENGRKRLQPLVKYNYEDHLQLAAMRTAK